MITVACVLRQGTRGYDRAYVEKLRSMVGRHLGLEHRFVCLTDQPGADYDVPLMHDWPGWYAKLELFRPGALPDDEPALYLDLDTIITGPIDWMAPASPGFRMWWIERRLKLSLWCSAFMAWHGDYSRIYHEWARCPEHWLKKVYTHWPRKGDQVFIAETCEKFGIPITDIAAGAPERAVSQWPHVDGKSLIWFSARDKPHLVADHEFVAEHWR